MTILGRLYRRTNSEHSGKIQQFLDNLQNLCDLSHSRFEDILRNSHPEWEIDRDFLLGQRKIPQVGSMAGVDRHLADKEKRKVERERRIEARKEKERQRQSTSGQASYVNSLEFYSEESSSTSEASDDEDYCSPTPRTGPSLFSTLELPTKDLILKTADVAQRYGVARRVHLFLAAAFIKAGPVNNLNIYNN